MRVTILRDDNIVLVNGRPIRLDLSDFPTTIHAVQWDGTAGHIEYKEAAQSNEAMTDLAPFQPWIDRWETARVVEDAPHVPTPEELAAEAERAAIAAAKAEAKADAIVQYLHDHTPAEAAQYVQDNVTDLASAKAFLKKVAVVLSVLAKESLR